MNKGLAMSTEYIIVYINADDYFFPRAFSAVIPSFQAGYEFVVGKILEKSIRFGVDKINDSNVKYMNT